MIVYLWYILTDMKKKLIVFSDEQAKELESYPNQSDVIRNAFEVYNGHISTDTLGKLRVAFTTMTERLNETNDKLDKLLRRIPE